MYKEYLEKFLTQQVQYMNNLHNSPDCIERLYHQAYGACLFVEECLCRENPNDEAEWLVDMWQAFQGEVFERFGYQG